MLMTFLGMKLKVTQNRRRKERVCRMLPFPLCITVRRLVTIPTAWGNFAHAHIVITNWLIEGVCINNTTVRIKKKVIHIQRPIVLKSIDLKIRMWHI